MDEPFSALDVLTAENLRTELVTLWATDKFPTKAICLVTHNIEEAVLLADRVVVLGANPGRILAEVRVELERPETVALPRTRRWSISSTACSPAGKPLQVVPEHRRGHSHLPGRCPMPRSADSPASSRSSTRTAVPIGLRGPRRRTQLRNRRPTSARRRGHHARLRHRRRR